MIRYTSKCYSSILKSYVIPAVFQIWDREQKSNIATIKGKPVSIAVHEEFIGFRATEDYMEVLAGLLLWKSTRIVWYSEYSAIKKANKTENMAEIMFLRGGGGGGGGKWNTMPYIKHYHHRWFQLPKNFMDRKHGNTKWWIRKIFL